MTAPKPHHINNLKKVTKAGLKSAAVIADGSPTKMGKLLGIAPSTAYQHLQKPELNNLVSSARAEALKKSKLSLVKAYKRVNEALDAKETIFGKKTNTPDHDTRLKAAKQTHDIFHPKEAEDALDNRPIMMMPVVVVNGVPLTFKVGKNANS